MSFGSSVGGGGGGEGGGLVKAGQLFLNKFQK